MSLFTGTVKLRDAHGLGTTKNVVMDVDESVHITTIAQITAARSSLQAFVDNLDVIIDAVIESASLNVPADVSGGKSVPGDQGVAEGANLALETLDNDGAPQVRPYWLPSADAGIFNANFRTVDTADGDLLAWLNTFNTNDVMITISDGEEVTGIDSGVYATRRRTL